MRRMELIASAFGIGRFDNVDRRDLAVQPDETYMMSLEEVTDGSTQYIGCAAHTSANGAFATTRV